MALQLNFHPLRVFQVVNDHLTGLLRANSNCMTICAKTYCSERCSHFNFLDLLTLHDVIKEYATVKTGAAEEQVVDWTEGDAGADVVMGRKLEAQRIGLRLGRVRLCTSVFVLGYNLL